MTTTTTSQDTRTLTHNQAALVLHASLACTDPLFSLFACFPFLCLCTSETEQQGDSQQASVSIGGGTHTITINQFPVKGERKRGANPFWYKTVKELFNQALKKNQAPAPGSAAAASATGQNQQATGPMSSWVFKKGMTATEKAENEVSSAQHRSRRQAVHVADHGGRRWHPRLWSLLILLCCIFCFLS